MEYQIENRLLKLNQRPLRAAHFIIAHESGNPSNTGPKALENEVQYMSKMAAQDGAFSSHWVGGGGRIIQIAKTGFIQYGAGTKANPYAYAQVELARTNDPNQFKKDYQAYVWLLRKLATEANLPLTLNTGNSANDKGIKTHHWISKFLGGTTHTDPDDYLASFGISLKQFAKDLTKGYSEIKNESISYLTHVVKKGDTLWDIAKKYHSTVSWLRTVNKLPSEVIYIGQTLKISENRITLSNIEIIQQIQRTVGTTPDGSFGPKTKKAIFQLFQRAAKIYPDGIWSDTITKAARTVQLNCHGWDVYAVQAMLYCKGYTQVGSLDKNCGPLTVAAVKQFQQKNNLVIDGKCGPRTTKKLFQ